MSLGTVWNLGARRREPELMDDPAIEERRLRHALDGIARVNFFSRTAGQLWAEIKRFADASPGRTIRLLDLACGGGDVDVALVKLAAKAGVPLAITGCDFSSVAVRHAEECRSTFEFKSPLDLTFEQLDVVQDDYPSGYDVVASTMFLHHLEEADAVAVLRKMRDAAASLVLVDDLSRSRLGYVLAWCGTRLLSRSRVTHVDGPRSVAGAFTPGEMIRMADAAGLAGARIRRHWPERFLLSWSRA